MFYKIKKGNNMEEKANELYHRILSIANHFLQQSKAFSVHVLNEEKDPDFKTIAKIANKIVSIIEVISDDFDPTMHQKALDYTHIISKMAVAIEAKQQEELDSLVEELNRKPFL